MDSALSMPHPARPGPRPLLRLLPRFAFSDRLEIPSPGGPKQGFAGLDEQLLAEVDAEDRYGEISAALWPIGLSAARGLREMSAPDPDILSSH